MQHNRKKEMGIKWVRSRAGFGGETGWKYRLQRCFDSCKNVAERYFAHIDWRGLHCDFIVYLNAPKAFANWLWCTFSKEIPPSLNFTYISLQLVVVNYFFHRYFYNYFFTWISPLFYFKYYVFFQTNKHIDTKALNYKRAAAAPRIFWVQRAYSLNLLFPYFLSRTKAV